MRRVGETGPSWMGWRHGGAGTSPKCPTTRRAGCAGPRPPCRPGRGRRPRKARLVPGAPAPQRVDQVAAVVPPDAWQAFLITEGSQGPWVAECACQRGVAVRAGLPGPDGWIVVRRTGGEPPERKVSLSNAPGHILVTGLVRVAGMRWPMETAFEESQGALGLDHYEVRSWLGWHHHMTLGLLAHHCLVRTRIRLKRERQR